MAEIAPGTRQWLQLSAVDQITGAWNKRPEQTKKWLAYMYIYHTVREANFEQEGNFVSSKKVLFISLGQRINFIGCTIEGQGLLQGQLSSGKTTLCISPHNFSFY